METVRRSRGKPGAHLAPLFMVQEVSPPFRLILCLLNRWSSWSTIDPACSLVIPYPVLASARSPPVVSFESDRQLLDLLRLLGDLPIGLLAFGLLSWPPAGGPPPAGMRLPQRRSRRTGPSPEAPGSICDTASVSHPCHGGELFPLRQIPEVVYP